MEGKSKLKSAPGLGGLGESKSDPESGPETPKPATKKVKSKDDGKDKGKKSKKKSGKSQDEKLREEIRAQVTQTLSEPQEGPDEEEDSGELLRTASKIPTKTGITLDTGETPDEESEEVEDRDLIIIPYDRCLRCTHLVGERNGEKPWKKCYYKNGGELCPAKYTSIVKGLPIDATAAKLARFYLKGTPESMLEVHKLHAELTKSYDGIILQKVIERQTEFMQNPDLLDQFREDNT
jgi:hypothetical protein